MIKFGAQYSRFGDPGQVREFGLEMTEERFDPGLVGSGPAKSPAIACRARNLQVDPDVIRGPLSDIARRIGWCSSSIVGSATIRPSGPSTRAQDLTHQILDLPGVGEDQWRFFGRHDVSEPVTGGRVLDHGRRHPAQGKCVV